MMKTKTRRLLTSIAALCTIMLLFTASSCKKEVFNPGMVKSFSLQSVANGVSYDIKVALPSGYDPAGGKYATIYLLDGEEIFDFTANSCQEIAGKNGVRNALVVSIGYGQDRSIDYTPAKISNSTGGAPQFLEFIASQLIPRMEQDYHVDTSRAGRVILGHSYGGLFGAYAFCVNHKLFGHYLLLSPSLWFDNLITLQLEKDNRAINRNSPAGVFMGIGEAENSGRMQAPFESFYQTLRDNYPVVKLARNREKNLDHLASRNPNIIKGLTWYFQNR
jgi:predicted alpha/beta superfamily hydrolase